MPVNLQIPDPIPAVDGVRLAAVAAGFKTQQQLDLVLVQFASTAVTAGVFTRNSFCAAPVIVCRDHLAQRRGKIGALLINSGGANAATGVVGEQTARSTCELVVQALGNGNPASSVLPFSTGVIGEQLALEHFQQSVPKLVDRLADDHWLEAAQGIMTTDILPKVASRQIQISDETITLTGMAKGSGMIQPDMATMLAFMVTDAAVEFEALQMLLDKVSDRTFNSITVDGDTSTNDSCTLTATGSSGVRLNPESPAWDLFAEAVHSLALELAQSIVRDGEGATKFISIHVSGAQTPEEAKNAALTVGNSPLVKTAFFASDANLGRIIMAVGRSSRDLEIDSFSLSLDDVDVMKNGQPVDTYTEERGHAVMQKAEIDINIDLGRGGESWSAWTCDFSHEYVTINSDYRS